MFINLIAWHYFFWIQFYVKCFTDILFAILNNWFKKYPNKYFLKTLDNFLSPMSIYTNDSFIQIANNYFANK